MRHTTNKILPLIIFLLPTIWCLSANSILYGTVIVKNGNVQSIPRGSTIQATIYGHTLTVVFTENLGQVAIEVSTVSGTSVHFTSTLTPNGVQCFIPNTGDYTVTFTLPNGDEYYGEFTVTD